MVGVIGRRYRMAAFGRRLRALQADIRGAGEAPVRLEWGPRLRQLIGFNGGVG